MVALDLHPSCGYTFVTLSSLLTILAVHLSVSFKVHQLLSREEKEDQHTCSLHPGTCQNPCDETCSAEFSLRFSLMPRIRHSNEVVWHDQYNEVN